MPLPAPANFVVSTGAHYGEIDWSWDPVVGAVSYNFYRTSEAVDATYFFVGSVPATEDTTATNANLQPNTQYWYVMAAVDADGVQGALSLNDSAVTIGPGDAPPRAPSGVTVRSAYDRNILSWGPGAADVFAWDVKRSLTPGGPYTTIASEIGEPAYIDTGLTPETTYYYVIVADNLLKSADSEEVAGTPRIFFGRQVRMIVRRRR